AGAARPRARGRRAGEDAEYEHSSHVAQDSNRPIVPVRKLLNKLLAPTGYRIERMSRFARELQSLTRRPERRLKFVQIGASDGVRFDGLYGFVTRHPCSGIVVEPLPDVFERLRVNYADYPLIVPVNKEIPEREGVLRVLRVSR